MKRIKNIKKKRDKIANFYDQELSQLVNIQKTPINQVHGRYMYIFSCKNRNKLKEFLEKNHIESKIFYSPLIPKTKAYKNFNNKVFPNAISLLSRSLAIPLHENMTMKQAEYVVDKIKIFYNNH